MSENSRVGRTPPPKKKETKQASQKNKNKSSHMIHVFHNFSKTLRDANLSIYFNIRKVDECSCR